VVTGPSRPGRRDSLARLVFSQVAAVIAVTALLAGLFAWLGPDRNRPASGAAASSQQHSTSPRPATKSPPPSGSATTSPASSPTPSSSSPTSSPLVDQPEVVVLNQSGRAGLASSVAKRLRAAGWTVSRVGNFSGSVSTTTVYYPTGKEEAARSVADDLPGTPRVSERFSNLSKTRVTVVLTSDYAG
jgi:LytR cell envelope-related transcriptional attenuator